MSARASYEQDPARGELDFQVLVDRYYAPLYRFAMTLSGTEFDAADLVQETFLTWARKGHQLEQPAKIKGWLFTTLHRLFLQTHRRSARFPEVELQNAETELPHVDPGLIERLDGQELVKLLGQVDPQYQAAVALFYLEDYSYQEIADILQVPLGTVKSRIARGIGQLRALVLQTVGRAAQAGGLK